MALQKTKEFNDTGLSCEYWKINNIELDLQGEEPLAKVYISLYKDQTARNANKNAITNEVHI